MTNTGIKNKSRNGFDIFGSFWQFYHHGIKPFICPITFFPM
jgi:hypothetical protein